MKEELKALLMTLDAVEVKGKMNHSLLLGAMQLIEGLIKRIELEEKGD